MKVCSKCQLEKSLESFSWKNKNKNKKASECKVCHRNARNKYYSLNKEKEIDRVRERRDQIKLWYSDYKNTLSCNRCGFSHPAAMQFHHKDLNDKDLEISMAIVHGWSIERIKIEIEKCEILCANCHFIHHWVERN